MLLRSAEVKPLFYRFVQLMLNSSLFSFPSSDFRAGPVGLVLWSGDAQGKHGECVSKLVNRSDDYKFSSPSYTTMPRV